MLVLVACNVFGSGSQSPSSFLLWRQLACFARSQGGRIVPQVCRAVGVKPYRHITVGRTLFMRFCGARMFCLITVDYFIVLKQLRRKGFTCQHETWDHAGCPTRRCCCVAWVLGRGIRRAGCACMYPVHGIGASKHVERNFKRIRPRKRKAGQQVFGACSTVYPLSTYSTPHSDNLFR